MDHSYSTDRDSSRERERLHRQDHCYFAIADKTPLVVQRKVQQLQLTAACSGGREDHTYGRQASGDLKTMPGVENVKAKQPDGKENSTTASHNALKFAQVTEAPVAQSTSIDISPRKDDTLEPCPDATHQAPRQDHTYFETVAPKLVRKKTADTSRYDHVYCSATQNIDSSIEPDIHSTITERQSDIQSSGSDTDDTSDVSSADSVSYDRSSPQPTPHAELCEEDSLHALDNNQPHTVIGTVEVKTEETREDLACQFPLANLSVTEAPTTVPSCRMPLMPLFGTMEAQAPGNLRSLELITADHGYHSVR